MSLLKRLLLGHLKLRDMHISNFLEEHLELFETRMRCVDPFNFERPESESDQKATKLGIDSYRDMSSEKVEEAKSLLLLFYVLKSTFTRIQ